MGKIIKNGVEYSGSSTTGRDAITIKSDTTGDVTVSAGKITFRVTYAQIGTGLTRDNHSVLVGPGIDYVKVSASVFFHAIGSAQYGWFDIRKNDTQIGMTAITNIGSNNYGTATASDILIPVKEGDRISLYNRESNLQIRCVDTWMTVESVSKQMPATESSSSSYSYDELDTGGNWVDGKRIFKKTIHFGALPNNTAKSVDHGIVGLDTCVKFEGTALYGAGGQWWQVPLVMRGTETSYQTTGYVDSTSIYLTNQNNRSTFDCYITIYYTKS